MSNQSKISKEQLAKNMIMFIRHNIFLPENDKLKQFMKMIDDYIALSQILKLTNLKPLDEKEVEIFLANWWREYKLKGGETGFRDVAHAICSHFFKPQIKWIEKKELPLKDGDRFYRREQGYNQAIDDSHKLNGGV